MNDFNHPSKDYANFVSTHFPAQIMSTQNDDRKKTVADRAVDSDLTIKLQIFVLTPIKFSPVNTSVQVGCIS